MKKFYEKNETLISLGLIVIYLITNSYCMNNFGLEDARTLIANIILTVLFDGPVVSFIKATIPIIGIPKIIKLRPNIQRNSPTPCIGHSAQKYIRHGKSIIATTTAFNERT